MKHTTQQLDHWRSYERVRQKGRYNMLDQNARLLTGLTAEEYSYCMTHYTALKAQITRRRAYADAMLAQRGQP